MESLPSTYDAALAPLPGETELINVLRNSRERYAKGFSTHDYIGINGSYCAIGAVWAESLSIEQFNKIQSGPDWHLKVEREMRDATKEAIVLLNQIAAERHPEIPEHEWVGDLEWVNQDWQRDEDEDDMSIYEIRVIEAVVKAEVLAIYDEAIRRSAKPEAVKRNEGSVTSPDTHKVTA